MLSERVDTFLERLASKEPTPGGGSVAALSGALAAALAAMVCRLTIGKPKYAEHEEALTRALGRVEAMRAEFEHLTRADISAYEQLSAAYKLPRDTDDQKAERNKAIAAALGPATEAPLQIAELAAELLDLVPTIVEKGSRVAVSDAGMAALLAAAALRSGALNVYINLAAQSDAARAEAYRRRLDTALDGRVEQADALYQQVVDQIGGAS